MDISQWPFDKIMQLPDCCFGRRFVVSCTVYAAPVTAVWDISEIAYPEKMILWEVGISPRGGMLNGGWIRIALGDQLPDGPVMMDALEALLPGCGMQGPDPRLIPVTEAVGTTVMTLRRPVMVAGRRLVLEGLWGAGVSGHVLVWTVVSSIPREAPDWLNLAHL